MRVIPIDSNTDPLVGIRNCEYANHQHHFENSQILRMCSG